jgi:hypothetical protein
VEESDGLESVPQVRHGLMRLGTRLEEALTHLRKQNVNSLHSVELTAATHSAVAKAMVIVEDSPCLAARAG